MKAEYDLTDIKYVKVITIGGENPNQILMQEARDKQVALLNQCLNNYPQGRILGIEKRLVNCVLEGQAVTMEQISYHIGFTRKPDFLNCENEA